MENAVFGRLTVMKRSESVNRKAFWICKCSCGAEKVVAGYLLRLGQTKSCGCLSRELTQKRFTKHGMFGTPIYKAWAAMIQRCTNKKDPRYKDYGGRGIGVCERWLEFENFQADMGDRPEKLTLERKEVNVGYSPENCEWATQKTQQNNRTNNKFATIDGQKRTIAQWVAILGISRRTVNDRMKRGMSPEDALITPTRRK